MLKAEGTAGWFSPAILVVAGVTLWRILTLWFNKTDLFVDESQYWLWGQHLDFGYYSKPPLIAWVIRVVTSMAGGDAPFWVRLPGAMLHGLTAMVLGAIGARLFGAKVGFWVATSYVTAPFATVGSLLFSTDTVMAPAYATALFGWFRLVQSRAPFFAILAGTAAGLAFLAKYAAIYMVLGAALSALFIPAFRVGWRNVALSLVAFAMVISPNVIWNLTHDLTTVNHTLDNVGWVREDRAFLHPQELWIFLASQFAVFGPILFGGFLLACVTALKSDDRRRALVFFALPILLIVCVQALMSKAYANWAVATYFAGVVLVVPFLLAVSRRAIMVSVMINGAIAVLLPVLTIVAPFPLRDGLPLAHRYLGRSDLSKQIISAARAAGAGAVLAGDREILADLFYSGRDSGLNFYASRPVGRAHNYYEQNYPLPNNAGVTLYVSESAPLCNGVPLAFTTQFDTLNGAYADRRLAGYLVPEGCMDAIP